MNDITITLTDEELLAMNLVCADVTDWIENAAKERARVAIEAIVQVAVFKSIETQTQLPTNRAEIVQLAIDQGWVTNGLA